MTPPPLPPGCSGFAVAPDIHTGLPEPDRDGWTDTADDDPHAEILRLHTRLNVAITGLRELETKWVGFDVTADISALLDKIGATP